MKNETNQADEWASVWLTAVVAIGAYWALVGVPACTENERQGVEQAKQKHKEKINTILELNTLSISLTHKQCQKFDRAPEIEQLIRK